MNRSLKKVWNIVSTVLVALVVVLALLLAGARLLGMQVFTVLSGSMEPTYHTGSLIYVKKIDTADIQPGAVLLLLVFLPDVLAPDKDKKEKKGKRAAPDEEDDA